MIARKSNHWLKPFYFTATGGLAALVHVSVVYGLVTALNWLPLVANIWGFLLAFQVSYWGHRQFTFAKEQDNKTLRMPLFFLVASSAGLLNEALYYLILHFTIIPWLPALLLVLVAVAVYTYIASHQFALK